MDDESQRRRCLNGFQTALTCYVRVGFRYLAKWTHYKGVFVHDPSGIYALGGNSVKSCKYRYIYQYFTGSCRPSIVSMHSRFTEGEM